MTESTGRYKKRTFKKDQKPFSIRLDNDLDEWVEANCKATTKNRYINGLIRQDMELANIRQVSRETGMPAGELLKSWRELAAKAEEQEDER
jgi:hypothetical protein